MSSNNAQLRTLGKDGPQVPALGLGLMGLSAFYGAVPSDEERYAFLDHACKIGATFWDTADMYRDNEDLLGRWFKRTGKRDEIFLATKFGIVVDSTGFRFDSSPEYCKQACEKSLGRLGVEYIDLYYVHHCNHEVPVEQTMRAMLELKNAGKIKHIGLSNVNSNTLRRAVKIAPVAVVQVEYSPFCLNIEREKGTNLLATCRELGVSVVCYSPLGRGMLTSTFSEGRAVGDDYAQREASMPRFAEANREKNLACVRQFQELADAKGCNTSQLAIAWLLKQGNDIIPIPGTKKIKYLGDNWGALNIVLSDEEDTKIRKFVETAEIAGGTVPEKYEAALWADTKPDTTNGN